ncbi:nicotinamide riboside transporter PnuC [Acinetobacter shaoyimingii]|uniref:Nicotinamide riboside transporter PnuC n=1 Tax=Acinetobacter shaoyimingii TaxID=2715164 RepID=A0A6G8RTK3_9GAMM|nr:nicotinamide riboside transporter PnuC [Acinetobacter shaoyimingii]QIO05244.1 nicotinamide mononucleotide transporter [Acinetobacter shaoyimingii]
MSKLEISAFILNVLGVWLTSKQYRICWLINIVAVLLYAIIFYEVNLYADASLQVVFVLMQLYGWYSWSKKANQTQAVVDPSYIPQKVLIYSIVTGVVFGLILGSGFATWTQAELPWLDSMLASFSLVASYWAAKKYIETWSLWCVVDTLYVGMFIHKSLYVTALLYFIFIVLALNGWRMWRHHYQTQNRMASQI